MRRDGLKLGMARDWRVHQARCVASKITCISLSLSGLELRIARSDGLRLGDRSFFWCGQPRSHSNTRNINITGNCRSCHGCHSHGNCCHSRNSYGSDFSSVAYVRWPGQPPQLLVAKMVVDFTHEQTNGLQLGSRCFWGGGGFEKDFPCCAAAPAAGESCFVVQLWRCGVES